MKPPFMRLYEPSLHPCLSKKILGQPMLSTVNHLRQQVAKIAAAVKTTSWGGRHGHLALELNDTEYCNITGNPAIVVDRLLAPPIIPIGLTNTTTLTNHATIMGIQNLACQEFWKQETVDAIIINKIVHDPLTPRTSKSLKTTTSATAGKTSRDH